ncbi:hypothetical protein [Clostridium sp.]|uniref:hypothetical protein n=1 Tax=Clostridium sp. TaxID=1506 RepID=UPI0032179CAF
MNLYKELLNKKAKLSLIGLGYVGLPLAIAFDRKVEVIEFDINEEKINIYKEGIDPTNEIGDEGVKNSSAYFTSDESKFHVVVVPTPTNDEKIPDLEPS